MITEHFWCFSPLFGPKRNKGQWHDHWAFLVLFTTFLVQNETRGNGMIKYFWCFCLLFWSKMKFFLKINVATIIFCTFFYSATNLSLAATAVTACRWRTGVTKSSTVTTRVTNSIAIWWRLKTIICNCRLDKSVELNCVVVTI
jgi:hypothetical protein